MWGLKPLFPHKGLYLMAEFEDPLPGSAVDWRSRFKMLESKVNVSKTTVSLVTAQDVWQERHVQELGRLPRLG